MRRAAAFAGLLLLAAPAGAEVVSAGPHAFEVRREVDISAPPATIWAGLGRIGTWWNPAHSFSGDARKLRLDLQAGACLCETLPGGGGVEHMRVAHVAPRERLVLTGALGPLGTEAVNGALELRLARRNGGTRLTATYRASGFARGNAAQLAAPVDAVLAGQWARLEAVSEGRRP